MKTSFGAAHVLANSVEFDRCRVQGAGCRVQGAGRRVQGAGCRVQGAIAAALPYVVATFDPPRTLSGEVDGSVVSW